METLPNVSTLGHELNLVASVTVLDPNWYTTERTKRYGRGSTHLGFSLQFEVCNAFNLAGKEVHLFIYNVTLTQLPKDGPLNNRPPNFVHLFLKCLCPSREMLDFFNALKCHFGIFGVFFDNVRNFFSLVLRELSDDFN